MKRYLVVQAVRANQLQAELDKASLNGCTLHSVVESHLVGHFIVILEESLQPSVAVVTPIKRRATTAVEVQD